MAMTTPTHNCNYSKNTALPFIVTISDDFLILLGKKKKNLYKQTFYFFKLLCLLSLCFIVFPSLFIILRIVIIICVLHQYSGGRNDAHCQEKFSLCWFPNSFVWVSLAFTYSCQNFFVPNSLVLNYLAPNFLALKRNFFLFCFKMFYVLLYLNFFTFISLLDDKKFSDERKIKNFVWSCSFWRRSCDKQSFNPCKLKNKNKRNFWWKKGRKHNSCYVTAKLFDSFQFLFFYHISWLPQTVSPLAVVAILLTQL